MNPLPSPPPHRRLAAGLLPSILALTMVTTAFAAPAVDVMPAPAQVRVAEGRLAIDERFTVALTGTADVRIREAVGRAARRWEERTGHTFRRTPTGDLVPTPAAEAVLAIEYAQPGPALPQLGDDESYTLEIGPRQAVLRAPNGLGVLRGLATLQQLFQCDPSGWFLPAVTVEDRPRFPWRGLMIDVCRHWQPIDVILRNLDGMALVKLNVLHLHLSEDQGFRVESKTHPELQTHGSDGHYFTQDELRTIVRHAADRGIRVVPEFDIPGHATAWVVSHPELASAPGPYVIERRWGVFDPVLDPTNEAVYRLLDDLIGEMAVIFPDPYFHIGGDENNGVQWSANTRIQEFIRARGLKNNEGLHAYFNQRVRDLLVRHGKKLVGWDEILHPELPAGSVVHSWRGPQGLAAATKAGFLAILSNGYYIDLCFPASAHYLNDPVPADTPMSAEEQRKVLGGEATMWAEWVTPETIDSRIWPRTAAIAERLWSPREVADVPDMYRRLAIASRRLEEAGLNHERNRPAMIRRFAARASSDEIDQLTVFIDAVEPVKEYQRGTAEQQPDGNQFKPLVTLADCARPESDAAREFTTAVNQLLAFAARGAAVTPAEKQRHSLLWNQLKAQLDSWREAARITSRLLADQAGDAGDAFVAQSLGEASAIGLEALDAQVPGMKRPEAEWRKAQLARLDACAAPRHGILLPQMSAIRRLVEAGAP